MKKLLCCLVVLIVVLSIGLANAQESRIPKNIQDAYQEQTGAKAAYAIWFPVVPEHSPWNWSNILIISNFNNAPITVACWFTTYGMEQTIKTYSLRFYEKKIVILGQAGFGDDLYDIFCTCSQVFGAAVLLLEGGKIVTAWPPIF